MDPFDESNINSLNVVHHCLSFLDANHTKNKSCLVSKSWNNHCTHETIWQIYTIRDFNQKTKQVPISELRAHRAHIPTSYSTLYTGGINYDTPTKLIVTVSTFREVWSCWKRLNKRTGLTNNLHYLKFATAWEKVLSWNENNMPHLLRTDAAYSKATNLCLGEYVDASLWSKYSSDIDLTSIHSDVKAFFACNNGQNWDNLNNKYDMHTSGQIGGFNVYSEYQCSVLVNVQKAIKMASALKLNERDPDLQLLPVTGPFGMYQGTKLYRFACVDLKTGFMYYVCIQNDVNMYCCIPMELSEESIKQRIALASSKKTRSTSSRSSTKSTSSTSSTNSTNVMVPITILDWWEEFVHRLTTNNYMTRNIFPNPHPANHGIDLFPRNHPLMVSHTTNGICVEASTIHLGNNEMGWTYSIRLKLIDVTQLPGYIETTKSDETNPNQMYGAQLMSRHWVITNGDTGSVRHVDGPGVVGCFPILHKDGYIDIQPHSQNSTSSLNNQGWFIYQSMSGALPYGSTFGGTLTFIINRDGKSKHVSNVSSKNSLQFEVQVPTFKLSKQEYYY